MSLAERLAEIAAELESKTMRVGIMETKSYQDGPLIAQVGYWNEYGTDTIPSRPFFRTAIANVKGEMVETIAKSLRKNDVETALRHGGEVLANELKTQVLTWSDPPNAPSTQRKKGFNAPLRGQDRLLRNSFTVEVSDD